MTLAKSVTKSLSPVGREMLDFFTGSVWQVSAGESIFHRKRIAVDIFRIPHSVKSELKSSTSWLSAFILVSLVHVMLP